MSIRRVGEGELVFPANVSGGSVTAKRAWTLITDQQVVIATVAGNAKTVGEPVYFERTGSPVETVKVGQGNKKAKEVEVVADGATVLLSVEDLESCGCGHPLKSVNSVQGVQKVITRQSRSSIQDKERSEARRKAKAEAAEKSRKRGERRAKSRAANRAKRNPNRRRNT